MNANARRLSDAWHAVDWWMRRAVAWPLLLVGASIVALGGGCILLAAWLADVPTDEEHL